MQLSSTQTEGISHIIREASKNPLGAVVVLALLVWALAYVYFGKERSQKDGRLLIYRFAAFVLVFLGAIGAGWLVRSLARVVTHAGDIQRVKQPIHQQPPRDPVGEQSDPTRNNGRSIATPEFASQIERARQYSRLTDYVRACEIYSAALSSLPAAALTTPDRETVSKEAKKCGRGPSQEAVERLDGIATRLTVE